MWSARTKPVLAAGLLIASLCTGSSAQTDEDAGLWLMLAADGSLGSGEQGRDRWLWWVDLQARFLDDSSGTDQTLVRPGLGYALGPRTSAWLGYAWVRSNTGGGSHSREHRIWEQLTWKPPLEPFRFQSRTRFEQRFLDTGSETGWRLRQFFKLGWALPDAERWSLVGYDEVFWDVNDTDWGQRDGFSQNRLFLGVGLDLGTRTPTTLEVGYLNQFLERSGDDQMNHILSLNLFLHF